MKKKKFIYIFIGYFLKLVGWEIRYYFFFNFFVVKVVDYLIFLSRLYLEFVVKI